MPRLRPFWRVQYLVHRHSMGFFSNWRVYCCCHPPLDIPQSGPADALNEGSRQRRDGISMQPIQRPTVRERVSAQRPPRHQSSQQPPRKHSSQQPLRHHSSQQPPATQQPYAIPKERPYSDFSPFTEHSKARFAKLVATRGMKFTSFLREKSVKAKLRAAAEKRERDLNEMERRDRREVVGPVEERRVDGLGIYEMQG